MFRMTTTNVNKKGEQWQGRTIFSVIDLKRQTKK